MAKKKAKPKPKTKAPTKAPPLPPPPLIPVPPLAPPVDRLTWQKEMASELGVTIETLREWSRRPGFPQLGTLDQIVTWRAAHVRSGGPPTKGQRESGYDPFSEEAQLEVLEAKAKNQLLKNEKLQEEVFAKRFANEVTRRGLVPRIAVESFLRKLISAARSEIEGWPSEVVTALPGKTRGIASDILDEKVRLLLVRMASWEYEILVDETVTTDGAQ